MRMISRYGDLGIDAIRQSRADLRLDVRHNRDLERDTVQVSNVAITALALLLEELSNIARYAPGGHGMYIDQACHWVEALLGADGNGKCRPIADPRPQVIANDWVMCPICKEDGMPFYREPSEPTLGYIRCNNAGCESNLVANTTA